LLLGELRESVAGFLDKVLRVVSKVCYAGKHQQFSHNAFVPSFLQMGSAYQPNAWSSLLDAHHLASSESSIGSHQSLFWKIRSVISTGRCAAGLYAYKRDTDDTSLPLLVFSSVEVDGHGVREDERVGDSA
jgi:hypothetical protein